MYKGPILWGHNAVTKNLMHVCEDQSYGTVHLATCTYARSQVRALCQVRRTTYMGTQHAQRVVVKRNSYRGYMLQYTESRYIKSVAGTNMHNGSLITGIDCMSHCL